MTQDELKRAVAKAAVDYILPKLNAETILGIGTGSTANFFIDLLSEHKEKFNGGVASSNASAERLQGHGIPVYSLNDVDSMDFYIDGADEVNPHLHMIKGGGAALTREKIVASVAKEFICIADESKWVETLGNFPLPVEVIPMAQAKIARELSALGGEPKLREGVLTDNRNHILDVHGLAINDPMALETEINQLPGVVTNGIFALRPANILMLGTADGVKIQFPAQ